MADGLGRLIVQRRRELGLTQQALARRIGVPTASMSGLEHTVSRWQSRLIVALAQELRLPQIELALAAGIITDLPPLQETEPDDGLDALVWGTHEAGGPDPDPAQLAKAIAALPAGHRRFLRALLDQLTERAAAPAPKPRPETAAVG